jgi:hypothetical protein
MRKFGCDACQSSWCAVIDDFLLFLGLRYWDSQDVIGLQWDHCERSTGKEAL